MRDLRSILFPIDRKVVLVIVGVVAVVAALIFFGIRPKGHSLLSSIVPKHYFQPKHRLPGIGADRVSMDDATLAVRTDNLIAAQTFVIMRNSDGHKDDALVWANRVNQPEMQTIITVASHDTAFSKALVEGIIFIESGGDGKAKSPTGPQGLMQMTAHIGKYLHLSHKETVVKRVAVRVPARRRPNGPRSGHAQTRVVIKSKKRVVVVDDRGDPHRAIPGGAKFLAELASYYQYRYKLSPEASQQFAVWEFHSGRGVVNAALMLAKKDGMKAKDMTLPRVFFSSSPAHNPELYSLIQNDLAHDYGPTYWFRVVRASQLLDLYRTNQQAYEGLMASNRSTVPGAGKAVSRPETWYSLDGSYRDLSELKAAVNSGKLVRPPNDPDYFSYRLRTDGSDGIGAQDSFNRDWYATDPPAIVGTLLYVASETRRVWEQSSHAGETFVPLEVTSMIRTAAYQERLKKVNGNSRTRFPSHTIGAVDVSFATLPQSEEKALQFVLDDLGFDEDIGYFHEHLAQKTMHFVPSPKQSEFFRSVYDEAVSSSEPRQS